MDSLLAFSGLSPVPDFSTLSQRQSTLKVAISYRGKDRLHPLIDSTGTKVEGEGEWQRRKHGGSKRRVWRKIHIAADEQTREIRAPEVTSSAVGDAPVLPALLDQIAPQEAISGVTADGAVTPEPLTRPSPPEGPSRSHRHAKMPAYGGP